MPFPYPAAVLVGTAANRPAAGSAGRVYIATDTGAVSVDGGSAWTTVPVGGGGGTTVLYHTTLAAATPSIAISGIPSTYHALRLMLIGGTTAAVADTPLNLTFNGDSGANYDYTQEYYVYNNAAPAGSGAVAQTSMPIGNIPGTSAPASASAIIGVVIPGYSNTTFHKGLTSLMGDRWATSNLSTIYLYGNWRSTAAINSITLTPASGSLAAGTDVTLFGE